MPGQKTQNENSTNKNTRQNDFFFFLCSQIGVPEPAKETMLESSQLIHCISSDESWDSFWNHCRSSYQTKYCECTRQQKLPQSKCLQVTKWCLWDIMQYQDERFFICIAPKKMVLFFMTYYLFIHLNHFWRSIKGLHSAFVNQPCVVNDK